MFAGAVNSNAEIMAALEGTILLQIDCEKGEGVELAKKYDIRGFPTFMMVDAKGEITDRWIGYGGPTSWAANVAAGKADRRTMAVKKEAYAAEPTTVLAQALANDAATDGDYQAAVGFLRQARELDPDSAVDYTTEIVTFMAYGSRQNLFTFEEVEAEVKIVFSAADSNLENRLHASMMALAMARQNGTPAKAAPFLKAAMQASEGNNDPELAARIANLQVDHALLVEKDTAKALGMFLEHMPEGWQDDSGQLNRFAWWCFENTVNLEEAEELALRGAELSDSDGQKANILDTAAEIAYARGDQVRAVELIQQAVDLDPEKDYFQGQLVRFEGKKVDKAAE